MRFSWLISLIFLMSFGAAQAQSPRVNILLDVMQMDGLLATISSENVSFADEMEQDLFPGRGGAGWQKEMRALYDPAAMRAQLAASFEADLTDETYDQTMAFFKGAFGQKLLLSENAARAAFLDPAMESVAQENMLLLAENDPERFALLEEFIAVNGLIDNNIMSGMNANFAFYRGLIDGNGFPYEVTEAEALADIWSGEEQLRSETKVWLFAFLGMAYDGISDDEMQRYIDFSASPAGKKLNRLFFDAFDELFVALSYSTGRAAARRMSGDDI